MSQEIIQKLNEAMSLLADVHNQLISQLSTSESPSTDTISLANNFEQRKKLLFSPEWPEAVPQEHICNETESDKFERAEGILELFIIEPLSGSSFLDYGCGEGHIVKKAVEKGATKVVGYDLTTSGPFEWEKSENGMLTTDFNKIEALGPYDRILVYDTLDHSAGTSMHAILMSARRLLKPNGKIFLRCHPWTGRHGGHLYKQINKSFVHFLFTKEELEKMGYVTDPKIVTMLHPEGTYLYSINNANLKIISQNCQRYIDNFFQTPVIVKYVKQLYAESLKKGWSIEWGQEFCDYILTY